MRVIELEAYGGPEALLATERARPEPGPGQVLVRVAATSLNPIDPLRASGAMRALFPLSFPFVPGGDFSGVVEAVGAGVHTVRKGQDVYGYSDRGGAYAEWIAVEADRVASKPANLTHVEAASLALVGQTGMQAVAAAEVRSGQTVLVHGAGGAVGGVAVQYAVLLGATVVATASAADRARVLGYGAARVIDRDAPFEAVVAGLDAVIDPVGGDVQARSYATLRPGGVLVALNQPPRQDDAERRGVRALMRSTMTSAVSLDALRVLVEAGSFVPCVGAVRPLAEAAVAWRERAEGRRGKTVFVVVE